MEAACEGCDGEIPKVFAGCDETALGVVAAAVFANAEGLSAEKALKLLLADGDTGFVPPLPNVAGGVFASEVGVSNIDLAGAAPWVDKVPNPEPLDAKAPKAPPLTIGFDMVVPKPVGVTAVIELGVPKTEVAVVSFFPAGVEDPKPEPLLAKAPNPPLLAVGLGTACPNVEEPNAGVRAAVENPLLPNAGPGLGAVEEAGNAANPKPVFGLLDPNPLAPNASEPLSAGLGAANGLDASIFTAEPKAEAGFMAEEPKPPVVEVALALPKAPVPNMELPELKVDAAVLLDPPKDNPPNGESSISSSFTGGGEGGSSYIPSD